jgi:protein KRI1
MDLFNEWETNENKEGELKVNRDFADKFEFNNKRVEQEKLQAKYGTNPEDEESYDSETEDDNAANNTDRFKDKFNKLLYRIENNDLTLLDEVKEGEDYFHDQDF